MTHILGRVGWQARQLEGGYRAFRRAVLADLDHLPAAPRVPRRLRHDGQRQEPPAAAPRRGRGAGARPRSPRPSPRLAARQPAGAAAAIAEAFRDAPVARAARLRLRRGRSSSSRRAARSASCGCPTSCCWRCAASDCIRLELPLRSARPAAARRVRRTSNRDVATLHEKLDCLVPLHGHEAGRRVEAAGGRRPLGRAGGAAAARSLRPGLPAVDRSQLHAHRRRRSRSRLRATTRCASARPRGHSRPERYFFASPRGVAFASVRACAVGFWKSGVQDLDVVARLQSVGVREFVGRGRLLRQHAVPRIALLGGAGLTDPGRHDLRDQVAGVVDFGSDERRQLVGRRAA